MKKLRVLGIMSGTSLDGIDYAICAIAGEKIQVTQTWQLKFPGDLHKRLARAAAGSSTSHEVGQLHHDLGRTYAAGARTARGKVDLAGLHGQTVYHRSNPVEPATFQLGDPAYLAEELRVPIVSNFRAGDMAAGGEGAPLATLFHQKVFAQRGKHICVNNVGGISNVTSLDWRRGDEPKVRAFDTGPGNVLIDLTMRRLTGGRENLDLDGTWAGRGKVHDPLVKAWLRHPFFKKAPPKSTGRELFGDDFLSRLLRDLKKVKATRHDCVATVTALTARSILWSYAEYLPQPVDEIILCGGGAKNRVLRELLQGGTATRIATGEAYGWPSQVIEAAAFAFLAYRSFLGLPGNVPETTGARRSVVLGQVSHASPAGARRNRS